MTMEVEDTKTRFYKNLDQIASDLIRAFGLEFTKEVEHLSDSLSRWLDFRLRYIDPIPRRVFLSNKFPKKLPPAAASGLHNLVNHLQDGSDVNTYQSKSLIRFHDMSARKRTKRTDLLWADWGITHLHVTDVPAPHGDDFSSRTCSDGECWLLFCIFVGDSVGLIDVRQHDDESLFSDHDLIETVKRSWPDYMDQFQMKGILSTEREFTNAETQLLRANGVSTLVCIDGNVYMGPGMGITSASTPLRVTDKAGRVLDWVEWLAAIVDDENGQFQTEVKRLGVNVPRFELSLTPNGLAVYEVQTNVAFVFSKNPRDENSVYSVRMTNLICPPWVLDKLGKQVVQAP